MPLYIGDYLADTGHLSTTQHGAYLLLIMHYWRKGCLPADDKQLAAIAKLPLRIWLDTKETIRAFFTDEWRHARIDAELEKRRVLSAKRADAGSRRGKPSNVQAEQNVKPEIDAEHSRTQSKSLKNKDPDAANAAFCGSMTQSHTQIDVDDAVDASTRGGSLITPEALSLTEKLLVIAGHDPSFWPPGWCGAPMRVQTWTDQGWKPEIIIAAVTSVAARKRGAPANSITFFEKAIAEEHARQAAPLPTVEIREPETITVNHGTRTQFSVAAVAKRQAEYFESQARGRLASDPDVVLSLPPR